MLDAVGDAVMPRFQDFEKTGLSAGRVRFEICLLSSCVPVQAALYAPLFRPDSAICCCLLVDCVVKAEKTTRREKTRPAMPHRRARAVCMRLRLDFTLRRIMFPVE